jgi:hypothetical protein
MAVADHENTYVREIDQTEGRAMLDRAAKEALGVSGDAFVRAWDAGDFADDDRPEVAHLAMLLPLGR